MPSLISKNQSAFIEGRKMMDNILLAQEEVKNYHWMQGKPRSAIKVDIMKTFDSLNWDFVISVLEVLQFPPKFIH